MISSASFEGRRALRRVLILADESANWRVAGLRQLDRLALALEEFARDQLGAPLEVQVCWRAEIAAADRWLPNDERLLHLVLTERGDDAAAADLVLDTHIFLYRQSVANLAAILPASSPVQPETLPIGPWKYLHNRTEIPACERDFLRHHGGKSQDGLVSRYLNRPISRMLSRWLLKLPLVPSVWSLLIFALPITATFFFLRGTYEGFVAGCAIFQLYSILDGCDGEIARAKFLQTEFGRRLDSLLDLIGNIMLALSLAVGLSKQANALGANGWFFLGEGIAAALLILTSEGIVFARRARPENYAHSPGRWNGVLYQRHHEFLERSGLLLLGERAAWWVVQLTKRDMGMLAFLMLALAAWPQGILHLLFSVSALSSAFAGNAFLRQPAPAVPQQAS